jgi:hypothetical protein
LFVLPSSNPKWLKYARLKEKIALANRRVISGRSAKELLAAVQSEGGPAMPVSVPALLPGKGKAQRAFTPFFRKQSRAFPAGRAVKANRMKRLQQAWQGWEATRVAYAIDGAPRPQMRKRHKLTGLRPERKKS